MVDHAGITAEEFATWLTPRQALNQVQQVFPDIGIASRTIFGRLEGGLIRAGAKSSSWGNTGNSTSTILIPANHWNRLAVKKPDWWDNGDVRFFFPNATHEHLSGAVRYFGVRFEPSGVHTIVADAPRKPALKLTSTSAIPPRSPVPTTEMNRGGRPRKEFWDDLLIAIFKQIWDGDLQPKSQADIERAMLEWASKHSHNLGETSVKIPAKKVFSALQK